MIEQHDCQTSSDDAQADRSWQAAGQPSIAEIGIEIEVQLSWNRRV
jgi:hypothetical protein